MATDRGYKFGWHPDRPWDGERRILGPTPTPPPRHPVDPAKRRAEKQIAAPMKLRNALAAFEGGDDQGGLSYLANSLSDFLEGYSQPGRATIIGLMPRLDPSDLKAVTRETRRLLTLLDRNMRYELVSDLYDAVDEYAATDPPAIEMIVEMERKMVFRRRWGG